MLALYEERWEIVLAVQFRPPVFDCKMFNEEDLWSQDYLCEMCSESSGLVLVLR